VAWMEAYKPKIQPLSVLGFRLALELLTPALLALTKSNAAPSLRAVTGVGSALLALVIDRRREFGLLRFLGAADSQIRRVILFEAGLLGVLANIAGVTLGLVLSLLLIHVINKQSFGWTIQFHWPVLVLLSALSIVYIATILSALYPARIATHLVPIEVIHEE